MRKPRPEHRKYSPYHDDDIVQVGTKVNTPGFEYKLRCTDCWPHYTKPVRKKSDPNTIARCAQCGKKHSMDNVEVTKHDRHE